MSNNIDPLAIATNEAAAAAIKLLATLNSAGFFGLLYFLSNAKTTTIEAVADDLDQYFITPLQSFFFGITAIIIVSALNYFIGIYCYKS